MSNDPFSYIDIVPYKKEWEEEFRSVVKKIKNAFPDGTEFYHIGSTAVPGLAAKDIIDLQASVLSLDSIDADFLRKTGFTERLNLSDHAPKNKELRPDELKKRFFRGSQRPANLHIRVRGKFNETYSVLCRDYLRHHPTTASSYQSIKETLSSWFPEDIDRYYDIKDPVFDIIMDGAESWASQVSWKPPKGDL